MIRQRACGVVIRDNRVLMVRHVHHGRDYWTLPGGGINPGESHLEAARREVLEETGIDLPALKHVYVHEAERSVSHCVLMGEPAPHVEPVLGADPEEAHLPEHQRLLRDVGWHELDDLLDHAMINGVMKALREMSW